MSLYSTESLEASPSPAETLAVLAEAIGDRIVPARHRVAASSDSHSPDEGLALLTGYVAITDPQVRQAILDVVIAIAGTNAYR